jgi:mannose-6-phosphate isomerase-like protein (cupin superfamily)
MLTPHSHRTPSVGVEVVKEKETGELLAIIIRHHFRGEKYNFFTPPGCALQVGINVYPTGEIIQPHLHPHKKRFISQMQECVTVRKGRLRMHIYNSRKVLSATVLLESGDVAFQAAGGHGFEVLEDCQILEVKQGPYSGDGDKVRFSAQDLKV